MNKYQTYTLTGRILALDSFPSHRELIISCLQKSEIIWEKFVKLADYHLVLQTLYPKIRGHELEKYFPEEVLEHLKHIFDLTSSRNQEIIKQVENLTSVLHKSGIPPLYMKGVGNILDGLYRYPGERILHDIDILVPEPEFIKAANLLLADGYQSNYSFNSHPDNVERHYPILYKPGEPVYVELHRMPVGNSYIGIFNTEMVFKSAKKPGFSENCLVMSDEHKIIHNFIHAQLDHKASIYARDLARNLYDLLLLSGRADPERVFSDFGHYRRTASGYLDIAYDTFGNYPDERNLPALFLHTYRFRYQLNIKSRFAGTISYLLIRIFLGWVVKPFKAITNRKIRRQLIDDLGNPEWYRKQKRYYGKILGIR